MTLPASGAISLNQVNVELGLSGTTLISMNQASVRTLFGVPSGAISMSNGYGKSNSFSFAISSNQTNANLRTLAVNAGWNQSSQLLATINSGIYIYSTAVGTPGLTINGAFPAGVVLTNNGLIVGMGGGGGNGANYPNIPVTGGGAGGLALSVSSAVTINNGSGTVGGGGGGGGGSQYWLVPAGKGSAAYSGIGGSGGRVNGAAGYTIPQLPQAFAGSLTAAGPARTYTYPSSPYTTSGGAGGNLGASGGTGSGPGGGSPGGASGAAVSGNSFITWSAVGTRLGSIA